MNWEDSRAVTPFKRDFLKAFFERNDAFFLTGGSALGVFYLDHRRSFDLDLFTTKPDMDWHVLDNEIRAIAALLSAKCSSVVASPTFRRYELVRAAEREIVDFVVELAPQVDSEKRRVGSLRVDTLREIVANKICTLVGRCEVKDLVDLYFLDKHGFRVADYFADAKRKEGGLDPAMLSHILSRLRIERIPDYVLDPLSVQDLGAFVDSLRRMFAEMAYPK